MARRSTNAFGEAWQGSKIRGAGSLARARGYAYGALTSQQRGEFGSQANFQAAAEQAAQRVQAPSANPSGETPEQREERLKKKGREEVMTRDPEYVQKPAPMAKRLNAAGEVSLSNAGADSHDGLMRYGSTAAPKPRAAATFNQDMGTTPLSDAVWGALVNGSLSETALKELEAQQEAQAKVKLLGDTSPAALAKIRRAINRREQRPSYTPSGQVIRGGW